VNTNTDTIMNGQDGCRVCGESVAPAGTMNICHICLAELNDRMDSEAE